MKIHGRPMKTLIGNGWRWVLPAAAVPVTVSAQSVCEGLTTIPTADRDELEFHPFVERPGQAADVQNTIALRIGWVESKVFSNSFNSSQVNWCPSSLSSRK